MHLLYCNRLWFILPVIYVVLIDGVVELFPHHLLLFVTLNPCL